MMRPRRWSTERVLPAPDPQFRGRNEVAFRDPEADFPEPVRAPEGAPNVLLTWATMWATGT